MVLVTKLERAYEEKDAAAVANLASCPFLVGEYESDNISYMPPLVFAERFLDEVEALDLTLKEGDVGSTYPKGPTRIFLCMGRGRKQATLFTDHRPNADFRHCHVFSFERSADGWRITSYGTKDGDLLELLRRGYPGVLV